MRVRGRERERKGERERERERERDQHTSLLVRSTRYTTQSAEFCVLSFPTHFPYMRIFTLSLVAIVVKKRNSRM